MLDDKQEEYTEEYFSKAHKAWFSNPDYGLFEFIYKKTIKLSGAQPLHILDVGCGKGDFLKYIKSNDNRVGLFGIDLVQNKYPGINFIKGDFYDLKEESCIGKFNVISGLMVIEHLDNPNLFIQKLNSLLDVGGLVVITTINSNSLMFKIARFLNILGVHVAFDRLYSTHHLQHYTNHSLKKLLQQNGFYIILQRNRNYPMRAVDVPESGFLIERLYKGIVLLIFFLSSIFKSGIYQIVICKKGNVLKKMRNETK